MRVLCMFLITLIMVPILSGSTHKARAAPATGAGRVYDQRQRPGLSRLSRPMYRSHVETIPAARKEQTLQSRPHFL